MNCISIKNLNKKFKKNIAVKNLSFNVPEGKIFGLLGSNGAGKTTTINILTGLLLPDSGEVRIFEKDIKKDIEQIRKNISLVPQTISLYEDLTIYENLDFFGGLYIKNKKELKEKIQSMLNVFELNNKKNNQTKELSGGYKRRCSIACSVISNPKLLFLDEPLTGIDINTNKIILNFLKSIKGMTIIFTTHSIKQAESICDQVVFLNKGEKVLEGTPKKIINSYSKNFGEIISIDFEESIDPKKIEEYLKKAKFNITEIKTYGHSISFTTKNLGNSRVEVISAIKPIKSKILNIDIKKPNLEDIFYYIIENENKKSN